jgi:hypothetical protein
MKIFIAILMLCAFAPAALAAGADCRAVESTSARLACYDAASPPKIEKTKATEKATNKTTEKTAAKLPENDPMRPEYKDPFLAEEARTNAKLKGICRGC